MANPAYVAVDWGTSSFRLWLIADDGSMLGESRGSEGMAWSSFWLTGKKGKSAGFII